MSMCSCLDSEPNSFMSPRIKSLSTLGFIAKLSRADLTLVGFAL